MARSSIDPLVHSCVIRSGSAAGNRFLWQPDAWDIMRGEECPECGHSFTDREVIAHIYEELTGGSD